MNKDVSSILDLIGQLSESVTTPVDVNHGLNAQQKSVPQLPAQARARKTSVLATKKDPKHPFAGYMVGSDESVETDEKPVEEGLRDPEDNPCWSGYHPIGTKKKAGRTVPNCVPNESINEVTAPPSFNRQLQDKLYQDYAPGYGEPFHQGHVDNIIKMATTNQWQEYLKSNGKLPWVTALVDREKKEWNTWHEKKAAEIAADNTARKAAGTYGVTLPEINQRVAKKLAVWLATQLEAHGHDADVEEILDQTFDAGHTPSGIEYYESSYETFFAYVGLLGGNKLTKPILMHSDAAGEMETVNKHKGAIYNISGPHNGMSILTRMTGPRYGSIPIDIPNDPNTPIYELDAGSNGGDDNEGQNWEVIAKDPDPNKLLGMLLDLLWGNTIPNELGESLSPFNDDHRDIKQKERVPTTDKDLKEVDFNPGRRGFLKKAGAAAATAAMPKGIAGAAAKAVAPAASIISSPFVGLTAVDLDEIINLLDSSDPKNMIPGNDPYDLDIMKSIAVDAARTGWGNVWMRENSAKSFLDAVELGRKNGMSDAAIIDNLKSTAMNLFADEMELLKPEDKRKVQSQSLRSHDITEPAASPTTGMSGLARAAGTQIGRTMKNVGKATATTVLNQPARDMGRIEPTTAPAALPAPAASPGMQIPKQKSRVSAEQDKELGEAGKSLRKNYNPDGKTFKGDKNKMPTYDPDDAMMQGDYDQLDTVSAADTDDEIAKAEHRMDLPHLKQLIKSQLKILDKTEREILNYLYWHDQPLVQIAKTLGMEPILVHRIKDKALKKLLYSPGIYNIAKNRFTYPYARINDMDESLSPFNDDHSELDQFVKEEFNREIDEEVTERQISVRRLADIITNEILRNKDALRTYGQDKIIRAASSVASEWVDRKFSKEHLPVMVKSAMDKISSNQLDEFDASGFSERYTMYCDNDVFGRYEDVDDAVADAQQMMNDDYRMKGCIWVLKDISGETVWSQEPGDIIDAARMRHKMRFIDRIDGLDEDRDQPVNQGWNDFTVDGYRYEPWEEEEFDRDNKKIHHSVRTPAGEVVSVDWDPYEYMEPGDLKSWIDLGMPTRQHAGTIGPLRADHLDQLAAQKKTVDETSFADAGEVVGGIVGGPAAFALARGRGGKKTYAAGSVAGSAIGNAAGRWIDNKLAPAAGVDQHGPGPMAKRYTKPIDESPETLYFFDVANTTGSYTDQQLRALGLRQTRSGKWYYKPIGNNAQAVDAIAQRLNVQPKPWTPVREGNPAADWPIFGESQDNTVASHTFADTGSAFRNGQEDAMNFRPKNDAKYIRGHKYRSNYSDGYKYGLTQQDRSINPKTGQPYVLFGPNGPTTDSDPERSMHGDGPHVWVCSSYRQAKKQADKWGQKVARAGVSKWKVVPKDDPAPEIFSESDLNEVTGDKSFDSMMGNIVKGARYKGAKADQQADTAYGNMIQGITKNTNAVRQPSSNSKFEQIYNQVERILLSSHIHSEIDDDIWYALEELKIKSTDKLIQKLENTLVSRVSDVLKFYDESDLEEQGVPEGIETKIRAKNQAVVKKIQGKEVKEDITQEDIITKLKARLGDYLSDLGQQIKKDPALKDKLAAKPKDTMGPAVKTVTTDDGQTISIHGNEDDGFRISIKNKPATAKFKTVDEAALACNMFNARRKNPRINTDYVDEA